MPVNNNKDKNFQSIYPINRENHTCHSREPARNASHSDAGGGGNPSNKYRIWSDLYRFRVKPGMTALFLFLLTSGVTHPSSVYADTLLSPSFEVRMSTINITGGSKSSASYKVTDTVGQTAQGEFNSNGFTIKAGFQYIHSLIPFSFKISNLDINFGPLIPENPSLLSNILTVTTGSAYGYSVKAVEDHPLRLSTSSTTIPDTSCDLVSPCTPTDATPWVDNTRFGFGYNIQGDDVDTTDFVDTTYYRSFPIQNIDSPAVVMNHSGVATNSAATVTYKVNISKSQAAGVYQNNIQYIAIPSF